MKLKRKIIIKADLKVLTGMHIGGSNAYSAIGTPDSPVVRSALDGRPIVPGSSLKGKLRTLLASVIDNDYQYKDPSKDDDRIKRLFGASASKDSENTELSKLQFADAYVKTNQKELTEIKFENTISRGNCTANPRQIERVVPGVVFETVIVYQETNPEETEEDLKNLAKGMRLLQYDYLGGHGTRGYGRVSFKNISVECLGSDDNISKNEKLEKIFEKVESDELLHL